MLVRFRIDLPCMSVAFVATLVLGVVLVMTPSARTAVLQEEWLLPVAACLLVGVRQAPRPRGGAGGSSRGRKRR
ncbi:MULTISPECIES: hypothetical protein [unclassified Streptomyces]|uniref:hypothetical protein n=1 Tax=unclassified Streptomyces TaxID=2593676 RepID=UPI002237D395|nr:hypothetical protein [Streptomyces sp. SHP 1-2]MCW5251594.1 hypothetical protein [Streptomyces sp. SHP 1-2]